MGCHFILQETFPAQGSNLHLLHLLHWQADSLPLVGKEFACNTGVTGDMGSTPGSGRFSGGGNGNPFHYSCLENSMDREAWWVTVHGVAKELDTTER